MHQIFTELEKGLNVSVYAKKYFNEDQMEQIRLGLETNLDVSKYTKKEFDWKSMKKIRRKLEKEAREKLINGKNIQ